MPRVSSAAVSDSVCKPARVDAVNHHGCAVGGVFQLAHPLHHAIVLAVFVEELQVLREEHDGFASGQLPQSINHIANRSQTSGRHDSFALRVQRSVFPAPQRVETAHAHAAQRASQG